MFTEEEKRRLKTKQGLIQKWCDCGTLIWEVPSERFLPKYTETILCTCGKDHSRKAPLGWRLRHWFKRVARRLVLKLS